MSLVFDLIHNGLCLFTTVSLAYSDWHTARMCSTQRLSVDGTSTPHLYCHLAALSLLLALTPSLSLTQGVFAR